MAAFQPNAGDSAAPAMETAPAPASRHPQRNLPAALLEETALLAGVLCQPACFVQVRELLVDDRAFQAPEAARLFTHFKLVADAGRAITENEVRASVNAAQDDQVLLVLNDAAARAQQLTGPFPGRAAVRRARAMIAVLEGRESATQPSVDVSTPVAPCDDAMLPDVPLDAFPSGIGEYLAAVAENRCVDPAMPATFALGVAAAAIGRAAEIELRPDWRESGNLWLAHVAPPGKQKSPTLKAMAAPLYSHDNDLDAEHAAALAQWENECDVAESCKRKAPDRPRRKQAVVADVTIESLGDVLEVSPRVAGVYDELGALLDGMGAYKKSAGADRQNWLSLHAGARITVNRKGKDPLIVEAPRLGIIGATTPATAARVLGTLNGDGMVDRFFLTASRAVANRFKTPPVPPALREHYLRSIAALCALPTAEPRVLSLTAEAAELFGNFYDATDASGAPAHFQGVIGKLCGHVGVLARTLALWSNPQAVTVSGDVMRAAIRIGQWLTIHTSRVRSAQILSRRAAALVAWLGKHDGRAALRDVVRANVAGVKTMEEAEALANEAARAGAVAWANERRELVVCGGDA